MALKVPSRSEIQRFMTVIQEERRGPGKQEIRLNGEELPLEQKSGVFLKPPEARVTLQQRVSWRALFPYGRLKQSEANRLQNSSALKYAD